MVRVINNYGTASVPGHGIWDLGTVKDLSPEEAADLVCRPGFGYVDAPVVAKTKAAKNFPCPDGDCSKAYVSQANLDKHLDTYPEHGHEE